MALTLSSLQVPGVGKLSGSSNKGVTGLPAGVSFTPTNSTQKTQAIQSGTALGGSSISQGISQGYLTPSSGSNFSSFGGSVSPLGYSTSGSGITYTPSVGRTVTTSALESAGGQFSLPTPTPSSPTAGILENIASAAGTTEQPLTSQQEQEQSIKQYEDIARAVGLKEPQPLSDEYQRSYETNITPIRQEVNNLKSQIGAITAQANADILASRNQSSAEGGTAGILSAREDAISRSAAIKTLPLSASLAAAQDNLALAEDYLNTWFSMKKEDIDREYQYRSKLFDSIKDDVDKKEQKQWELQKMALNDAYDVKNNLIETQTELIRNAVAQGAPAIIIQRIRDAQDSLAAISAAGKYGSESVTTTGSGVSGGLSNITQSIINNPSLFDDLTPTVRGQVISELQANGYNTTGLGLKGLSDTAIKEVAQTQKALSDLDELKTKIQSNLEFIGPISGLAKLNPFSKARQIQADVDRVRQTVGKALEGGVLRKEDEEKYKKILATLTDTPETALYKIEALQSSIQRDIENYKSLQQASGKSLNVSSSLQKEGTTTKTLSDYQKLYQ